MIRDLPRGQFDAYLRTHYFGDKPGVLPRFSMGSGAIFMIQRVKPLETSLVARGTIAETDPLLLKEMVSLVTALKLDVVSISEMRRRLKDRDLDRRFVCFTFDGAYRSVLDTVLPLFGKHGHPFTVYAATDYLATNAMPWWLSLEALVSACDKLGLDIGGEREEIRCWTLVEKQDAYARIYKHLAGQDRALRASFLDAAFKKHGLDQGASVRREMLSRDELRRLGDDSLVTIGSQGGGDVALGEMPYDRAREGVEQAINTLEAATGRRAHHFAFPGGPAAKVTARDMRIAMDLEFETAVTGIEGALWPEHARDLMALPRVALDNDPATLVRALMLSGGGLSAGGELSSHGPVARHAAL